MFDRIIIYFERFNIDYYTSYVYHKKGTFYLFPVQLFPKYFFALTLLCSYSKVMQF